MDRILYFCLSSLERGGRHNLPVNVGRYIDVPFLVLALIRSHKGIEFHFGCWYFSNGQCFGHILKRRKMLSDSKAFIGTSHKSQRSFREDFCTGPHIAGAPVMH